MTDYIVYLLINTCCNNTYVGMTNNKVRRLRQHNGELVGGAKYTTSKKGDGEWMYYGYIENLDKSLALSLEKRIQIKSRRMKGINPLERRLAAIKEILLHFYNIPEFIFPINPVSEVNGIGILHTNSCLFNFFSKSLISNTKFSGVSVIKIVFASLHFIVVRPYAL